MKVFFMLGIVYCSNVCISSEELTLKWVKWVMLSMDLAFILTIFYLIVDIIWTWP